MLDSIQRRKSIRTYKKEKLSTDEIVNIRKICRNHESLKGPLGNTAKFFFYENQDQDSDEGKRIGTYGFIKNAPAFFGGITENTFESLVDFGYLFENIIIQLTKKDYATCWLGGTFKREEFNDLHDQNHIIPAISPVGRSAEKASIREKIVRMGAKADTRLPFEALFFDENLKPLEFGSMDPIARYFKLVQIAPSASNKQPWRIVKEGDNYHFYLKRTPNYAKRLSYDIQAVDIGIAIAHFEIGLKYDHVSYTVSKSEPILEIPDVTYVLSITVKP